MNNQVTQPGTFKALIEAREIREKEEQAQLEVVSKTSSTISKKFVRPDQPNIPNIPNQVNLFTKNKERQKQAEISQPVSPNRDFTKVANSIAREAVPNKLFKGMSKNTYDALYLRTRGAISPVRSIRATKPDLMRWAGVSDVTLDKHLKHLRSVGLISVEFIIGSHEGNSYEVRIPEEIGYNFKDIPNQHNQPNITNLTNDTQPTGLSQPNILGDVLPKNIGDVGWGESVENKEDSTSSKTSLKTNTKNDDESTAPFSEFVEKISAACVRITGKPTSKQERERWGTFADLIILELEIAAKKTNMVSSVPSFLTEVLRRKLLNQPIKGKSQKPKVDTVGKSEAENYEIKPLDENERKATLAQLREFAESKFLKDFEKWYLPEDWSWFVSELEKSK